MILTCNNVMTPRVLITTSDEPVEHVAGRLSAHNVGAMPVCDPTGQVIGMIGEFDLVRPFAEARSLRRRWWLDLLSGGEGLAQGFVDYLKSGQPQVHEVMTASTAFAIETTSISEAVCLMMQHRVHHLPVLRDGKIVGIISRTDLIRALAQHPSCLDETWGPARAGGNAPLGA